MATASQDREARFQDLLMPIRDLAKNWNVDIACNLEDYLTEVGILTRSECRVADSVRLCID